MYREEVKTSRRPPSKSGKARSSKRSQARTRADWEKLAGRELKKILKVASGLAIIRKLGPKPATSWAADVSLIGTPAMTRLNSEYRGKNRPTDVLSFSPPEIFQKQGQLGELVICLPVLKKQAAELGHRPELELRILLVHGILHLLGMDHELGPKQAKAMARLEQKLLTAVSPKSLKGLIDRSQSET